MMPRRTGLRRSALAPVQKLVRRPSTVGGSGCQLVADGVVLVVADEHVDVAVERGREQQRLAVRSAWRRAGGGPRAGSPCRPCGRPRRSTTISTSLEVDDAAARSRSARRPGQATAMSTPRRSALSWRLEADAAVERPRRAGRGRRPAASSSSHDLGGELAGGDEHERASGGAGWPWRRGRPGGCRRRGSCPSRSGPGRRGRGRRGRRAASPPGSGRVRGRRGARSAVDGRGHAEGGERSPRSRLGAWQWWTRGTPQLASCTLNRATCEPKEADTIHEIVSWPAGSGSREQTTLPGDMGRWATSCRPDVSNSPNAQYKNIGLPSTWRILGR